jgi:nicotinamidase-related amidase
MSNTALMVMDLQADIVARFAEKSGPVVERTAGLIAAARKAKAPVIYICVGFRAGYPELNPSGPMYSMVAGTGRFITTTPGADVAAAVKPQEGDVVIIKHRVGAFWGTDLEVVLRAKGITTLVLTGIATSGVVLSTVRHAADADYKLIVVKDCCADADDEVHRVLTEKVFPRQASVKTASEVAAETFAG